MPSAHERLQELEERIAAMEGVIGVESGLRASGDRDLADVVQAQRAQRHLLQAISITQSEHTETLLRQDAVLLRHAGMLNAAHEKLDLIVAMLGRIAGPEAEA
jgi:hypothetical protein